MSDRVLSAEKLIEQFSQDELVEFSSWFAEFSDGLWEKRIEQDSLAGRLDHLVEKARANFKSGSAREI